MIRPYSMYTAGSRFLCNAVPAFPFNRLRGIPQQISIE
jgi:hypothetical protein